MPEKSDPSPNLLDPTDERFRLLVDSVKDYGIFMLDPQGRIASWNTRAERMNGYRAEEIIGSHFSISIRRRISWRGNPSANSWSAQTGRVEDEGWLVRKDGTRFWADVIITALRDPRTGELRGYGKVTQDLTERRKAEELLRRGAKNCGCWWRVCRNTPSFFSMSRGESPPGTPARTAEGYKAEEIIGQSFTRFYTAEDQAAGRPQRLLEQARREGVAHDRGMRVRKDGTLFPAEVLITAVHDEHGRLRGFSKVTRDITNLEHSRQMEMAKLAAEKANEAKDHFLAILSHELRTPLTPVLAAADYLCDHLESLPLKEIFEHVGAIRRNAKLEAQLIDDLLDLTRSRYVASWSFTSKRST